jgi:hypothetical protein
VWRPGPVTPEQHQQIAAMIEAVRTLPRADAAQRISEGQEAQPIGASGNS